jgi:putative peptide zinc metalloprotease protein
MFVCSVSTVIFNANPLLRYDGYYILSDLSEIPNLRQKSTQILGNKLSHWCLGLEERDDAFLPERNQLFFAGYSIAAAIYRWVVLVSILLFMWNVLEPYGLKVVSQVLGIVSIASMIGQPIYKVGKFFYTPGRMDQVKWKNVWITTGIVTAVLAFVCLVPLPHRVMCALEIKPQAVENGVVISEPVYVDVAGRLDAIEVKEGQAVMKDQVLARLSNVDLQLSIAELEGKRGQYEARLKSLERTRFEDEQAALEYPQVQESLKTTVEQLAEKSKDLEHLVL